MSKTNNFVFWGLYVIAWLIFVGLSIEAGGLIVNFFFSIYKPEFVQNLYQNLDLSEMYNRSQWDFYKIYSLILSIAVLKACLFYAVIRLMHTMDFSKPFNHFVSKQISSISYYTFSIGILSYIAQKTAETIPKTENLYKFFSDSEAFILMSAVVYIIAVIFKKGIELQNENDLTI